MLGDGRGVDFNVADVSILAGNLLLVGSLTVLAIPHRERLIPPREWEKALYRQARRLRAPRPGAEGASAAPRPREARTGAGRPMR